MTKASDNIFPKVLIVEGSAPSSPSSGDQALYIDSSDHKLKRKNSSGTVTTIEGAATTVATDTIWDAKGDVVGGTGADTAARLAVGANGTVLTADSTQTTGLKWAAAGGLPAAKAWVSTNLDSGDYPGSPTAYDDEFDDTTGNSGAVNGLDARWTWRNQGSATVTFTKAGFLSLNSDTHASDNMRIIEQTIPAGDWTVECKVGVEAQDGYNLGAGLALIDSAGGGLYTFAPFQEGTTPTYSIELIRWTNVTTYNSTTFRRDNTGWGIRQVVLRCVKASTTYSFWYGDGIAMQRVFSSTLAITPTRWGLAVNDNRNSAPSVIGHFDYFKKTA